MEEKKAVKTGYERIKTKVKEVRQDYRKAVNEGRRSGKLVCDNWHLLKNIWGGSPATTAISNSRSTITEDNTGSQTIGEEEDDDDDEVENTNVVETDHPAASQTLLITDADQLPSVSTKTLTAKFVDNKRKMLEKNLSASQRDQIYLNLAKDELHLKQSFVNELTQATRESNKAFGQISESITSVGNSIGNGLALLAQAIGGCSQQNSNFHPFNQQPNTMHTNVPYGTGYEAPMQANFTHNFRHSSAPSQGPYASSYSNCSQVSSNSHETFNNSPNMEDNKTYDQL